MIRRLRTLLSLRIVRVDWPFPALELVRPDGSGWLLMRLPEGRYRVAFRDWPRPALLLADTPRPGCPDCCGRGGYQVGMAGCEEPDEVECSCWEPTLSHRLVPVPRWVARRWPGHGHYSTVAPF